MRTRVVLPVLVVFVAAIAASCSIPLSDLGGAWSTARDINEGGVIVGSSYTAAGSVDRPFVRQPDGTVTELPSLPGSVSGRATAINDAGVIAGTVVVPAPAPLGTVTHAVRWDVNLVIQDLGPIGKNGRVTAIDAQGRIVGMNDPSGATDNAFVFDPAVGHMVDLPELADGKDAFAWGMNDEGDVVGGQFVGAGWVSHAVRWDLDAGTVVDLGAVWGLGGHLQDINDAGTIIGHAVLGDLREAAIMRVGETGPTFLGAGPTSAAVSINEDEVVVGWNDVNDENNALTGAYRWTASTGAVFLTGDMGSWAAAVNDKGQMVGQSEWHAALFIAP